MRNGQQKRMRGRNNRRGSNPLTRVYESNGPDVKVRGTAHHIAEKYQQLARDAQSSGDPVAAENYLQHAEHYLRLIASMQGQFAPQAAFGREDEDEGEEMMEDVGALDAPQPFVRNEPPAREPRENVRSSREGSSREGGSREARSNNYRRAREEIEDEGEQPEVAVEPPAPPAVSERSSRSSRSGEGTSRSRRAPRAAPVAESEEEAGLGLPSFITGTSAVSKERAETRVEDGEAADEASEAADGRVSRRRRRYRPRTDRAEDASSEAAPATPEQQPLFGE